MRHATSHFRLCVGGALVPLAAACAADRSESDTGSVARTDPPAEWIVVAEPELQIGVVEGDPGYQFHTVVGAVRLPDGRIAVLNAGSHELRIYGPDGQLQQRTGRRGGGPGEFQRPLRLYLLADTLAIYDVGLARLSLHALDGQFIAVRDLPLTQGRFALDEWLHDRSWIDGPPLGHGRAAVVRALARLPAPDTVDAYRYVRVTPIGLWVRQPAPEGSATTSWHVHDLDGAAIARVDVPADHEVYDVGAGYLLARWRDSLDVEFVRLSRLDTRGVAPQRYTYTRDTTLVAAAPADTIVLNELRAALRMLSAAQEIHYSNPASQYAYADHLRMLERYEEPEGVTVRIVNAHERGWTAVAIHRASGIMCGVTYGSTPPVGWTPGVAACL